MRQSILPVLTVVGTGRFVRAGFDAFVRKPIEIPEMVATVQRLLVASDVHSA